MGGLGDRRVPVDLLERAVVAAAQRGRQPVRVVLVVVEAQRLLARVALRRGMLLVTASPLEPPRGLAEACRDAAVALAEDAGGGLVLRLGDRGLGRDVGHPATVDQSVA